MRARTDQKPIGTARNGKKDSIYGVSGTEKWKRNVGNKGGKESHRLYLERGLLRGMLGWASMGEDDKRTHCDLARTFV
jgi:hypothetical protein